MNKYIKINSNDEIIDVFFDYQKNKFDGTEILIEENVSPPFKHKINEKSISTNHGVCIFIYENGNIIEKNQSVIDASELPLYLESKIQEARTLATTRWIDSPKAVTAIQGNYNVFKNGSYATIGEVDVAFIMFVNFMEL